jgi:choline-sulfatase
VLGRLDSSRFRDDTIVVYTSDHGEMLGAHGGMHQKWHNAYDETIRVPLLIAGPGVPAGSGVDHLSSHVDLLPTLLGLAGLDAGALARALSDGGTPRRSRWSAATSPGWSAATRRATSRSTS